MTAGLSGLWQDLATTVAAIAQTLDASASNKKALADSVATASKEESGVITTEPSS